MWEFVNSRNVKAAKPYKCDEAGCEIAKGEVHQYTAGKVEGYFEDYRLCLKCAALAAAYCREFDDAEGWPMGALRESIREEAGVDDIDAWLAGSEARAAERQAAQAEAKARRDARFAALDGEICDRCHASLATFSDKCTAALDDRCPGFLAIERARSDTSAPAGA